MSNCQDTLDSIKVDLITVKSHGFSINTLVDYMRHTLLPSHTSLLNTINNENSTIDSTLQSFYEMYISHDIPTVSRNIRDLQQDFSSLDTDLSNILKSVYNSTPGTKTVLDYLNDNSSSQTQQDTKLDDIQSSIDDYEDLFLHLKVFLDMNTISVNSVYSQMLSIYNQSLANYTDITSIDIKVGTLTKSLETMQIKLYTLENKINALQNFDPTTIENKLDKILNFLGQDI